MIYVSIDLETGGLDAKNHSVLEFGAIIEDTTKELSFAEIPKYSVLLERTDNMYVGSAYALAMHKDIFTELAKKPEDRKERVIRYEDLPEDFYFWLIKNCPALYEQTTYSYVSGIPNKPLAINVAGKNFGTFDKLFIENYIPNFTRYVTFKHKFLDPGILYLNMSTDKEVPGLSTCKQRAHLADNTIAHRALKDAMDVIEVLRYKLYPTHNDNGIRYSRLHNSD